MFDLAVKQAKVYLGSLFELSWYYSRSQCYISNFKANRSTGSRERFVTVFIMNMHGGHVGYTTGTIWTNFSSLSPRRLYMKFYDNLLSGFWGDVWSCNTMRVHTNLHVFIQTNHQLLDQNLQNMRSYVLAFFHIWTCRKIGHGKPKVILWTILVVLSYQIFTAIGQLIQERKCLKL